MASRLMRTAWVLAAGCWVSSAGAEQASCPLIPLEEDPICSPKALNQGAPTLGGTLPIGAERVIPLSPPPPPATATPVVIAPPTKTIETAIVPVVAPVTAPSPTVPDVKAQAAISTAPSAPVAPAAPPPAPVVAAPAVLAPVVAAPLASAPPPVAPMAATTAAPAVVMPLIVAPPPASSVAMPATAAPLSAPAVAMPAQDFFGADPNAAPVAAAQPAEGGEGDLVIRETRRVALVIGNGDYATAPLKNPVNDAQLMEQTLTNLGFEVMARTNVAQRDMRAVISEFGAKIRHGGVGLFYYAGHGIQIDGENYLIPIDAQIENEGDVDTWGVNMETVLKQMGKAENHLNIVVLDACRDNPFARSWRSGSKGLAELDAPTGTYVAYATAPGRTASDGDGDNGLYTQALAQAISTPGLRLEDVFIATRRSVERRSSGSQTPWENGSLKGVFYFNQAGVPQGAPAMVASTGPVETKQSRELLELAVWSSVKNSKKKEDLDLYLSKFPKGVFAEDARKRVAYLDTPAALIDAMDPGSYLALAKMPLLDASAMHKFGDWLVVRKPNKSRARVMAEGLSKMAVLQTTGGEEEYFFYYQPDPKVAMQLTLDEGDETLRYQGPKYAMTVRGCKDRSRASRINEREDLDFAENLRAENAIEIPDGYGVVITTDAEHPDSNRIRRDGDSLTITLSDIQASISPNAPELRVLEGNNDRCTFR